MILVRIHAGFFLALLLFAPASGETLFTVGNQFTWDSRPTATAESASIAGRTLDVGYHIRNSSTLRTIADNPTSVHITPTSYGTFAEALPNYDWDFVGLTSFPRQNVNIPNATLGDDLSAASELINLTESMGRNSDTEYYIYSTWPPEGGWDSWKNWVPDDPDVIQISQLFFQRVVDGLRVEHGQDRIKMIPTGDVVYRLMQEIEGGTAPQLSSVSEIYNGPTLSAIGDYAASTTVLATVLQQDPRGLAPPELFSGMDPEISAFVQNTVWDVVNFHPYTGVAIPEPGDFDHDGDADADDLELWRQDFGSTSSSTADANADGIVNAADYVVWRNNETGSKERQRLYMVGNSLTNDSRPLGTEAAARSLGYPLDVAWHLRSNTPLKRILTNPTDVDREPAYFGPFTEALPNYEWDYVTLQSFPTYVNVNTLGDDHEAANDFIALTESNPLNADTKFYVYTSWPHNHVWSVWDREVADEDDSAEIAHEYYEHLVNRLRADHGDDRIFMVPTGDVLYEVKMDIEAGLVPGLTQISDLYRDLRHLNALGRYIASTTTLATILHEDPRGIEVPEELAHPDLTEELVEIFQDTIWEVVNFHPHSGVAIPEGSGPQATVPEPTATVLLLLIGVVFGAHRAVWPR